LLRYQLYDCSEDKISLEKEIEYIRSYVSFQQIRKEENLIVDFKINAEQGKYKIAPLLLVILIENAFKFVSNFTDRDNKITIRLTVVNDLFTFYIGNTIEQRLGIRPSLNPRGGIGIANLQRRLELLYPEKHEISFNQEAAYYESTLTLQLA